MTARVLRAVHGWGTHSGIFTGMAEGIPDGWRLEAVDLPGHGNAPEGPLTLDSAIATLAGGRGGGEVWLGWSLGAIVALAAAAWRAGCPAGLILIGPTPRFLAAADWPHGMARPVFDAFRDQLSQDLRQTLERFIALEVHGSETARQDRRVLREVLAQRPLPSREALASGLDLLAGVDLRPELSRVRCPVLVVAGEHDRIVHPRASQALAEALPNARAVTLPGGGHAPFLGQPRRFARLLTGFLEEVGRESAA